MAAGTGSAYSTIMSTLAPTHYYTFDENAGLTISGFPGSLPDSGSAAATTGTYIGTLGTNTYDGLQTRMVGRYSGYTMNFTYTFSKALGYGINPSINIPDYFRLNRSEQSNSLRHVFSASIVAELPFGKTRRWAKNGVPAVC